MCVADYVTHIASHCSARRKARCLGCTFHWGESRAAGEGGASWGHLEGRGGWDECAQGAQILGLRGRLELAPAQQLMHADTWKHVYAAEDVLVPKQHVPQSVTTRHKHRCGFLSTDAPIYKHTQVCPLPVAADIQGAA